MILMRLLCIYEEHTITFKINDRKEAFTLDELYDWKLENIYNISSIVFFSFCTCDYVLVI